MGKLEKLGVGLVVALLGVILMVALLGGDGANPAPETANAPAPEVPSALSAVREVDSVAPGAVVNTTDLAAPANAPINVTEVVNAPAAPVSTPVATPVASPAVVNDVTAPVVTPVTTPATAPVGKEVVVKSGDSLWKIAAREVSNREADAYVKEIRAANNLEVNARLKVGAKLILPPHAGMKSVETPVVTATAKPFEEVKTVSVLEAPVTGTTPAANRSYTVKKGDALALIAQRECGSVKLVAEIIRMNGLKNGNVLKIGQVLQLPARVK